MSGIITTGCGIRVCLVIAKTGVTVARLRGMDSRLALPTPCHRAIGTTPGSGHTGTQAHQAPYCTAPIP